MRQFESFVKSVTMLPRQMNRLTSTVAQKKDEVRVIYTQLTYLLSLVLSLVVPEFR